MAYSNLELSILKILCSSKKEALEFISEYDTKLFSPDVWFFASSVISYIKTFKDVPTLRILTERFAKNKDNISLISDIWNNIQNLEYNEKEYKYDLEKLKAKYAENELLKLKEFLSKDKFEVSKAITETQKLLTSVKSLNESKTFERRTLKEALPEFVEKFNAKKQNEDIQTGLMTHYSFLDNSTNGIKPADFIIVAGESGFGKSLLLNNMAIQTWMQGKTIEDAKPNAGKNIIYFSLEMPYEDCFNRLISRLSGVPSKKIETAKLSKEEFANVKKALDFIKTYPYTFEIVDMPDASANDIEAVIANSQYPIDAIFIDYLGIMRSNENKEDQDWLKQGIISYETRAIGRKHNLPIFTAVQLNRKAPAKDSADNIGLNRLARSGTIATHATTVIQIENRTNEEQYSDFLVHIIKQRKGPKGKGRLLKNLACAMLTDNVDNQVEVYSDFFTDEEDISAEMQLFELD